MRIIFFILSFPLTTNLLIAQEQIQEKPNYHLILDTYYDITKSGGSPFINTLFDINKLSIAARYNYDWDKSFSFYLGTSFIKGSWNFHFLEGLTIGNRNLGISLSPISVYDREKVYLYNNPQVIFGIENMPIYFSHWGEFYYKLSKLVWTGIGDRLYFDNEKQDIAIGPIVYLSYKKLYLSIYYWIPSSITENRVTFSLGYEKYF